MTSCTLSPPSLLRLAYMSPTVHSLSSKAIKRMLPPDLVAKVNIVTLEEAIAADDADAFEYQLQQHRHFWAYHRGHGPDVITVTRYLYDKSIYPVVDTLTADQPNVWQCLFEYVYRWLPQLHAAAQTDIATPPSLPRRWQPLEATQSLLVKMIKRLGQLQYMCPGIYLFVTDTTLSPIIVHQWTSVCVANAWLDGLERACVYLTQDTFITYLKLQVYADCAELVYSCRRRYGLSKDQFKQRAASVCKCFNDTANRLPNDKKTICVMEYLQQTTEYLQQLLE